MPVYNEREVLPLFLQRLKATLKTLDQKAEILFVDDGSRDGSADYLIKCAQTDTTLRIVRLSRNFGKEAALSAGLHLAQGNAVIIIDADLQDPPEEIPRMLRAHHDGADVVCMRRSSRPGETHFKKLSAHWFYRILNRISRFEIPEDTGDFRLMSRRALDALNQLPERQRYMKGLFAWVGFPTTILHYAREVRAAGNTKWNYPALFGLAFEGITSFSITPLRYATAIGALAAVTGLFFGLGIVIKTLIWSDPVQGYPSLMAMLTFLGGVQLLGIGLLGEYVGKTYFEAKQRPLYLIRDVVGAPNHLQHRQAHTLPQVSEKIVPTMAATESFPENKARAAVIQ
ncbi:Glycosyl transferase, family 2 [gamma proteobacterium HdN1]|nr:Glycosyl transferase, family 2 [gamma proteobacterium HdN1]